MRAGVFGTDQRLIWIKQRASWGRILKTVYVGVCEVTGQALIADEFMTDELKILVDTPWSLTRVRTKLNFLSR